jgi:ABC-type glycerol-3-phosphate transport system permease component
LILAVSGLLCLIPLLNTVAISFSDKNSAAIGLVSVWPVNFTPQAYIEMLQDRQYFRSFSVSILRVLYGGSVNIGLSCLMAYALSKSRRVFHARNVYMWITLFTMLFSGGLVAHYLWIKYLGLMDTLNALVLPGAVPVYSVIVLMNYFKGIPDSLEEAALVDGANPYRILAWVYLPLSLPALATIALFSVVGHWNAYFDGLIYINTPAKLPLQTYIQTLSVELSAAQMSSMTSDEIVRRMEVSSLTFNCAKVVVCTIPVLIIYPFLQKYFVTGLVMGAVKG